MKVALIGYGRWGKNLYRSISRVEQVTDVYIVDPFLKDSNNDLKKINFDQVLSDKEIESVIVASPSKSHFDFTKNLILNNKNVFCEKPLCFSSAEVSEIKKLVEKHKKTVLTGHTFLFNDSINYVKNYIEENSLSFKTISGKYCSFGTNVADVDVLWDFGPHVISIMNYVLSSKASNIEIIPYSYRSDGKLESCILNLKYFDGLTNVIFELSWLSIDKKRSIEFNNYETLIKWDDVNLDRPIEIYEKQLDEKDNYSGIFEHFHTIGNKITVPSLSPKEPLLNEMNYFVKSVVNKESTNLRSGIEFTESVIELLEEVSSKI